MIGIDTSVIVRSLVGTPTGQARQAAALMDGDPELGISLIALVEAAHVLRTQYGVPRTDVVTTLIDLVTRENVATLELHRCRGIERFAGPMSSISRGGAYYPQVPRLVASARCRSRILSPTEPLRIKCGRGRSSIGEDRHGSQD